MGAFVRKLVIKVWWSWFMLSFLLWAGLMATLNFDPLVIKIIQFAFASFWLALTFGVLGFIWRIWEEE